MNNNIFGAKSLKSPRRRRRLLNDLRRTRRPVSVSRSPPPVRRIVAATGHRLNGLLRSLAIFHRETRWRKDAFAANGELERVPPAAAINYLQNPSFNFTPCHTFVRVVYTPTREYES